MESEAALPDLASFRKFSDRLPTAWQTFQRQRQERLSQQVRHGAAAEKVAENILEDFFTIVLDWSIGDMNNQIDYADIVLTHHGIKRLLVEVKRPGALGFDRPSLERALSQARRYADEQRVRTIAVSDGALFYAADIVNGGLQNRASLHLDARAQSLNSWWVSVDGIYRPPTPLPGDPPDPASSLGSPGAGGASAAEAALLHPKHKIPAGCFAYVGDASKTSTWKLPCRHADGSVDERHLSGAIRAALTNYRGEHLKSVPEAALPDVLVRLGKAAAEAGKLPGQTPVPLETYRILHDTLDQIGRLNEVLA